MKQSWGYPYYVQYRNVSISRLETGRSLDSNQAGFLRTYTSKDWYNPYPTAFPYGNGMVLHFYQQQESSTTKTVHKVINKGLKAYV